MSFPQAGKVIALASGDARNIDLSRHMGSVLAGAGATVTVSRVTSIDADAHGPETDTVTDVGDLPIWPFVRVSTAGGPAWVGLKGV